MKEQKTREDTMNNADTDTSRPTPPKQLLPEGATVTRVTEDRIYFIEPSSVAHAIKYGLQARYTETWIRR